MIFSLVTNGGLYDAMPQLRASLPAEKPLFIFSIRAPHVDWEAGNNQEIRDFVNSSPNTYLIDWYAASEGHPEYFAPDDTHLEPAGAEAFVNCIKQAVLDVLGNQ